MGVTAIFSQYPEEVVTKLCDPVRGLPATNTWLPSLAEIKQACERAMEAPETQEARDRFQVLVKRGTPQWQAWYAQWTRMGRLGCPYSEKMDGWMFPTDWPTGDETYMRIEPKRPFQESTMRNPDERARVIAGFAELKAELEAADQGEAYKSLRKPRSADELEKSRAYHEARLEDLKQSYAAEPVRLSAEVLRQFKDVEF